MQEYFQREGDTGRWLVLQRAACRLPWNVRLEQVSKDTGFSSTTVSCSDADVQSTESCLYPGVRFFQISEMRGKKSKHVQVIVKISESSSPLRKAS